MAGLYLIGFAAPAFEAATCHVGEMRDPERTCPERCSPAVGWPRCTSWPLPVVWLGVFGAHGIAGADSTDWPTCSVRPSPRCSGRRRRASPIWFMVLNMFHGTVQPLAGASRTISQLSDDGLLPRVIGRRNGGLMPRTSPSC